MINKSKDLVKNTAILFVGKLSTQLISFLLLPLYTFFLSPGEYGAVDLIITYIALFAPILTIQLEMASFRFLIDARGDEIEKKKIISNVMQIVFFMLLVFVIIFMIFSNFIQVKYTVLIILNIFVIAFSNLFLQFARGFGQNAKFATACIVNSVSMVFGAVSLITYLGLGAWGMLGSIAFANFISLLYLFFSLKLYNYINIFRGDKKLKRGLIKYSLPLIPNGISWWVISVSDRTIVSIFMGVAANGIYAVANKYAAIFSGVFSIFSMSWTESVSVHINDKDRDRFLSETVNASIKIFGSLGLLLIAYIPLVFGVLVNRDFSEAYLYIPILVLAAFFNMIVGLYSAVYIAKKLTKQVANTSIIAAVINIVLNLILIRYIGIYAAAFSTLIAYLVMAIYRHYDIQKYVDIKYEKMIIVKIVTVCLMTLVLYYINNIFINIINAVIITVIAILLNRSIIKVMIDKIRNVNYLKMKNK